MQCRSGGRSHWKSCCRITSWFSSHGSVLIALNQEVKSCFHVRHAASTYTLTEDFRGSMQWYQRPRIILNSQCLQVCFPNTHHSTTRHSCWRNVCKTGRFKNHPDSRADSLALPRLKAKHLQISCTAEEDDPGTWFWSSSVLKFSTQSMSRGPSKTNRRWQSAGQEENSLC